jgi:GMP synthase-like glutamine amidotransferase
VAHQTILVLDFGSQYTQLIARRLRELSIYSEILPFSTTAEAVAERGAAGIILSGGPASLSEPGAPRCDPALFACGVPMLGICYGFQAAMVEYARECCDMAAANTTENDAATTDPVVCLLPEQYEIEGIGGSMRLGRHAVSLREGSRVAELYGVARADERFRHRYEFNPLYRKVFEDAGMVFSGWAPGQPIVQVAELPEHPFFIGAQFHPEFTSRPAKPNPLFHGFVQACIAHRRAGNGTTAVGSAAPLASTGDAEVASGVAVARDSAPQAVAGGDADAATGSGNVTRSGGSAIAARAASRRRNPA